MEPQKRTVHETLKDLFRECKAISPDKEAMKDPWNVSMWDIEHKYFFFENNYLIAAPLDSRTPEQLMAVILNNALDVRNQPIFMGLTGKTKALSCLKSTTSDPHLEILEKDIMDLYGDPKNARAFTFYSKSAGKDDTCCFESAEFPGWFLSTSSEARKPVGLSQKGGPQNILFYSERKS